MTAGNGEIISASTRPGQPKEPFHNDHCIWVEEALLMGQLSDLEQLEVQLDSPVNTMTLKVGWRYFLLCGWMSKLVSQPMTGR